MGGGLDRHPGFDGERRTGVDRDIAGELVGGARWAPGGVRRDGPAHGRGPGTRADAVFVCAPIAVVVDPVADLARGSDVATAGAPGAEQAELLALFADTLRVAAGPGDPVVHRSVAVVVDPVADLGRGPDGALAVTPGTGRAGLGAGGAGAGVRPAGLSDVLVHCPVAVIVDPVADLCLGVGGSAAGSPGSIGIADLDTGRAGADAAAAGLGGSRGAFAKVVRVQDRSASTVVGTVVQERGDARAGYTPAVLLRVDGV